MKKILVNLVSIIVLSTFLFSFAPEDQKFEQPVLITSAGQSADVKLVKLLAQKQGLNAETKLMAKVSDLDGFKTLVIVPGFSSKGLGAAGISQEDEMNRVNELVSAANEKGIPIIMMHVGGKARRGGQSDGYCEVIAENSQSMIVVAQGNEDGLFTDIAKKKGVSIDVVDKISLAAAPLGNLFK